jgi:uncharacterized protein (TIGR00288 family)
MKPDRVALLIDADNVSIDVIEQAVAWVAKHYGGPHLRRAYCTPEAAVKHQDAFKRLSVRPMVNLAAGKNSTDIALAVDAIEIAVNEQPDVLVIASSDSDFAPVVARLRERGCRVVGLGQQGKVGQETRGIYDDYEVFEHRGGEDAAPAPRARKTRTARSTTTTRTASKKAAKATGASKKAGAGKTAKKTAAGKKAVIADAQVPLPLAADDAPHAPAPARSAKKSARKAAKKVGAEADFEADFEAVVESAEKLQPRPDPKQRRGERGDPRSATTLGAVLRALPELGEGATLNFNDVGQRLRAAGLLSKSGSSMKLLRQFAGDVILEPADRPSRVRLAARG